jgi:hypothetical protein
MEMPDEELKAAALPGVSKQTTSCEVSAGMSCVRVLNGIPISVLLYSWSSKAQTDGPGKS